jgi:hypothetical protein
MVALAAKNTTTESWVSSTWVVLAQRKSQQEYNLNLFNMTAWVFMCCELKDPERDLLVDEPEAWVPAAHYTAAQEPPQVFAPGVIKRWLVTDTVEGCAVVARQSRVSELLEGEAYIGEDERTKQS